MDFEQATRRAREVRGLLAEVEVGRHGRAWNVEDIALGFVGDVGDLAKLVQAAAGIRDANDLDARLAHELGDCLWAVLVLSDKLDVDLERAFRETMDQLEAWARREIASEETA